MKKYKFKLKREKGDNNQLIYNVIGTRFYIIYHPKTTTIQVMQHGEIYYRPDIEDAFIRFLEQKESRRK